MWTPDIWIYNSFAQSAVVESTVALVRYFVGTNRAGI